MLKRSAGAALIVAACVAGCSKDYPNPFENPTPTATPLPSAALLVTSNAWSATAGSPRDLFALGADGSQLTRLSFCNGQGRACDNSEVAVGRDRTRVVFRRVTTDANRDGRLTSEDGEAVVYVDLTRSLEATLQPSSMRASGLDWSPVDDILVYSALGAGGLADLFRMDSNGQNNRPLTNTPAISERRPRIDPTGNVAVFERIVAGGAGEVWIFNTSTSQIRVTQGGTPGDALPGTPYRIGSDADPDYSPDGRAVVFRRLTAAGSDGRGTWDLLTVAIDGTGLTVIATGARYRGAPDWGPQGIAFEELDEGGRASLVLLSSDGTSRRTLATLGAGGSLSFPRWLQ